MYHKEEINRALAQAAAEKSRVGALRAQLRDLDAQIEMLTAREAELSRQRAKEQSDVDALEGHGLTALFYAALGRREEKLDKEKAEALQAAAHHDAAKMQLANAQRERESRQTALDRLGDAAARYEAAYRAKLDWMRQNDAVNGPEIARLEGEKLAVAAHCREVREAIEAGERAQMMAQAARRDLSSAEGWGTWDLWGGGLIADAIKHEKLDSAQRTIYNLQNALSNFRTELADVGGVRADLNVTINDFLGFADFIFDGLFADWSVLDRIRNSLAQMDGVCTDIDRVLHRLQAFAQQDEEKLEELQAALDRLVETE